MRQQTGRQRTARRQVAAWPGRQRGSALIEYSIIAFLVVVVLISQDNVVARLMQAIRDLYGAFSFALSMTFPVPEIHF